MVSSSFATPTSVLRVKPDTATVSRTNDSKRLSKIRYTDTNEIVVLDLTDMKVFEEVMTNGRPVEIMGFAAEEDLV